MMQSLTEAAAEHYDRGRSAWKDWRVGRAPLVRMTGWNIPSAACPCLAGMLCPSGACHVPCLPGSAIAT